MIRMGFMNEYRFFEKDENGLEWQATVYWRTPTTAERVRYLIEASKISLKPEDRDASLLAASEIQSKYGRMIVTGVDGIQVPEGKDVVEMFVEYGGEHLGKIVAAAFNQGKEVEAVEGKSAAE